MKEKKVLITKIVSLILMVALLCVTFVPLISMLIDPLTYTKQPDGTYSVTDCYDEYKGKVIIPSTYNGAPVTSITKGKYSYAGDAFYRCNYITSVEIPESITNIDIFGHGDSPISIYYTGTVDTWSEIRFTSGYNNPTSQTDLLYIDNTPVTDINITAANKISQYAFCGYDALINVTIGDRTESIGDYAFSGCRKLTHVTMGDGVTSIGDHAFDGCDNLKHIEISDSITQINNTAFYGCNNIESVSLPTSALSYIPKDALKTVVITSGESIYSYALSSRTLKTVTIPKSVTSIEDSAFGYCELLRKINYEGTMAEWESISKGEYWDWGLKSCTIYCSDGTISK